MLYICIKNAHLILPITIFRNKFVGTRELGIAWLTNYTIFLIIFWYFFKILYKFFYDILFLNLYGTLYSISIQGDSQS